MPKLLYAIDGVQGNTPNLLLNADGSPAGSDCLSNTLNLSRPCFLRANAAGTVSVVFAGSKTDAAVTLYLAQGQATEGLVKRVRVSGTTIAAQDLALLYADPSGDP